MFWEWQSGHSLLWGGEGVAPFWRSWCVSWDLKVSEGRWTQAERRAYTGAWSPVGRVLWLWRVVRGMVVQGTRARGAGGPRPRVGSCPPASPGVLRKESLRLQSKWRPLGGRSFWLLLAPSRIVGARSQTPSLSWLGFLNLTVVGRVWRAEKREARSWDRVIWITPWRGCVFPADLVLL